MSINQTSPPMISALDGTLALSTALHDSCKRLAQHQGAPFARLGGRWPSSTAASPGPFPYAPLPEPLPAGPWDLVWRAGDLEEAVVAQSPVPGTGRPDWAVASGSEADWKKLSLQQDLFPLLDPHPLLLGWQPLAGLAPAGTVGPLVAPSVPRLTSPVPAPLPHGLTGRSIPRQLSAHLSETPGEVAQPWPEQSSTAIAEPHLPMTMSLIPGEVAQACPEQSPTAIAEPHLPMRMSFWEPGAITRVVERLVKQEVTVEIKRQREEPRPPAQPAAPEGRPPMIDVTSDEVVRALMHRLNALAREERFRLGYLG